MKKNYPLALFIWILGLYWQGNAQTYLTQTFESGSSPGWTQEHTNGSLNWEYRDGGFNNHPQHAYEGSYNAFFYAPNRNGDKTKLITPSLNLTAASHPQLKFYHAQANWGGDQDTLAIFYRTSSSGEWHMLASWHNNIPDWQAETIDLPVDSLSSDFYIAFEATQLYGFGVVLDNIVIEEPPSCPDVENPAANPQTADVTEISWDAGSATTWELEWGPANFTQGTGTQITNLTSPSYTISGLTPGSSYDVYIRADCNASGDGYGAWIKFTWTQPAANNWCSGAIMLNVEPNFNPVSSSLENMTDSGVPDPGCAAYQGGDAWFATVIPPEGKIVIQTFQDNGNNIDTGMALYSGTCNNLQLIGCDDDTGFSYRSKMSYSGSPGDTIFIRVWEYGNNQPGPFKIGVALPADNDLCTSAKEITTLNYSDTDMPVNATYNSELNICNDTVSDGVWYKFTINQANGDIEVRLTPDNTDYNWGNTARFSVYSGTDCQNLSCVGKSSQIDHSQTDTLVFTPADHTTYYINIDNGYVGFHSYTDPVGKFTLEVNGTSTLQTKEFIKNHFRLYPNPAKDKIFVSAEKPIDFVQIRDLTGQIIFRKTLKQKNGSINIGKLRPGIYLINVKIQSAINTYKFIKAN